MTEIKIAGGCLCGAIRFNATAAPTKSTVCYCQYCRRAFGAQSVAWLTFEVSDFACIKGKPASYASSPPVVRTFCDTCGTSLTYTNSARPDEIDVATAIFDDPDPYPPEGIVFPSRKLAWDTCLDRPVLHDD